jgi:hypothetical protein
LSRLGLFVGDVRLVYGVEGQKRDGVRTRNACCSSPIKTKSLRISSSDEAYDETKDSNRIVLIRMVKLVKKSCGRGSSHLLNALMESFPFLGDLYGLSRNV